MKTLLQKRCSVLAECRNHEGSFKNVDVWISSRESLSQEVAWTLKFLKSPLVIIMDYQG